VAYADLRLISHNLLPEELEKNGIKKALERLISEINDAQKIKIEFNFDVDERILNNKTKLELYSICLELINNVLRHAKAKNLTIHFKDEHDKLILKIEDDGVGLNSKNKKNGMGLMNLQNRIQSLNGYLNLSSAIPQGTTIFIEIPLLKETINFLG
jgi:signal transduction histidine kinase